MIKGYEYCPHCGGKLNFETEFHAVCPQCTRHTYINPTPTNGVIIENEEGKILLVERAEDPYKGTWDVPGGFIEIGETLEESVKRELREELNIEVEITGMLGGYVGEYEFEGINRFLLGNFVTAKHVSGTIQTADDVAGYQFFTGDEVLGIIDRNEIGLKDVRKALTDYVRGR